VERRFCLRRNLTQCLLKEAVCEAVNLASETETRVIDLANWINEMTGNKAGVVFKQRRDWDKAIRRRGQ
jgi:UDP-glucose 4-epimerase